MPKRRNTPNIDNPITRVEGDLEVIAWVNGTIGHRDSDDLGGRRYYVQECEYNGGGGD